jgi:hypothetical protein
MPVKAPSLRQPTVMLPLLMSGVALLMVLVNAAVNGAAPADDEGAAAHIFQLLLVLQLPLTGWLALHWLPRAPSRTWRLLRLQALAALTAVMAVLLLI